MGKNKYQLKNLVKIKCLVKNFNKNNVYCFFLISFKDKNKNITMKIFAKTLVCVTIIVVIVCNQKN